MANKSVSNPIIRIINGSATSFIQSIANPEYNSLVNMVLFVSVPTISKLIRKLSLKSRRYLSAEFL